MAASPERLLAADDLYRRHGGAVRAYCRSRLYSAEEAEDAVQTTFLNACRALGAGCEPRNDEAWLIGIARNVCSRERDGARRRRLLEVARDPSSLGELAGRDDEPVIELLGLEDALARLPEQQRRALALRELRGLTYREIAGELDVSVSAVEALIFRARRGLAEEFRGGRTRAVEIGGLLAALKGLFAGGAAVKTGAALAATAAVLVGGLTIASEAVTDGPQVKSRPGAVVVERDEIALHRRAAVERADRADVRSRPPERRPAKQPAPGRNGRAQAAGSDTFGPRAPAGDGGAAVSTRVGGLQVGLELPSAPLDPVDLPADIQVGLPAPELPVEVPPVGLDAEVPALGLTAGVSLGR